MVVMVRWWWYQCGGKDGSNDGDILVMLFFSPSSISVFPTTTNIAWRRVTRADLTTIRIPSQSVLTL